MGLDEKLKVISTWDRGTAIDCWLRYESLYTEKHGGGLHAAIIGGNLNTYIDKECLTFARYARMYIYHKSKNNDFDPHKFP